MRELDCRGLACPKPVLATKDAIEENPQEEIVVLVDNEAAKENVSRFLKSQGWEVEVTQSSDQDFSVKGIPCSACKVFIPEPSKAGSTTSPQKILVMIPADKLGHGSNELGTALMKNFVGTLKEIGDELWRLVLLNSGVRLAVEGSEHLDALRGLEKSGVEILVCGTCLNFYGLLEKKAVGITTNMLDIVTSLQLATKVIVL